MSSLLDQSLKAIYTCPNCADTSSVSFIRERSFDGKATVRCDSCGWAHSESMNRGYSDAELYYRGVAAYRPVGSERVAYPDEKTDNEILLEILSELKSIRDKLDKLDKPEVVYYQLRDEAITNCPTCAHYNGPIGQCERGIAGCKYEPDERERY